MNPPGSVVTGGTYTVNFSALGPFTLVSGPATLKSFSFSGYDIYVTYGDTISTSFNVGLNGQVAGNGTAGSGFNNAVSAFFSGPAGFHCSGGTCAYAGFIPSVTRFYTLRITAPAAGIAINGNTANVAGSFQLVGVSSGPALVSLSGQEVSRTFVPEPDQHWMVIVTMVSIAAARAWSRRTRAGDLR